MGPSSPHVTGVLIYIPLVSFIWCEAAQHYTINSVGAVSISRYEGNKKKSRPLPPSPKTQSEYCFGSQTEECMRSVEP